MEKEKDFIPELKKKGLVDLSALTFDFCTDDLIKNYYDQKLQEIENKDKWMEQNKEKIELNKAKILKAVEDGEISDDLPETIWQFQFDKAREGQKKVLLIKKELESKVEDIKKSVAEKLGDFLPDWILNKGTITFTMNEKADFCVDGDNITVDLGRLLFEKDFFEKTIRGIAHELFHVWLSEKSEWSEGKRDNVSNESLRTRIVFKTIDEGLAVLVSGQSLKTHHEKQGRKYDEFIKESFAVFNRFMSAENRKEFEKIKDGEFQNMGHFYVVGNEIVQTILKNNGVENFRKLVEEVRNNPSKALELYKTICDDNNELPKIE
jgi:hypothetical protein